MEDVHSRLTDRISNLPENAIETILMHLPTRDAVRSSILSRKRRHVWTKLPQLLLDETLWENVAEDHSSQTTFSKVLLTLLLGHDGPINKFTLSNPELESCTEIDNLISFLSKSRIEDFSLLMWKDCYLLPLLVLSCPTLRHLKLRLCLIRSFASVGFSRLTSLKLIEVAISTETLASLISGSPLLGILEIESSSEVNICIDSPNLRSFTIWGLIKSFNFKRVPVLAFVSIKLNTLDGIVNFGGVESNIVMFFESLLTLRSLQLAFQVVQSFGFQIQQRLETSLIHLKDLKLSRISFNVMVELPFTLCLLRSSSILKYIEILILLIQAQITLSYMEEEDFSDIILTKLREVKLNLVYGTKPELEFTRLLLAKSSNLKKIRIQPKMGVVDNGFKILKEVTKFRRISEEAEIMFAE